MSLFWIVTTDLSLSTEELRKAAHLRWHVENNVFKRISHLSGTRRFYFKDSASFFSLLRIFFAALAAYDILLYILQRNEDEFKKLLNGIKPTWRNIFSQELPKVLKKTCLDLIKSADNRDYHARPHGDPHRGL